MIVIPAIDISEGKCVRLKQGDMAQKTVFGDDPAEMARRWADCGAQIIHVVDLDGAVGGSSANLEAIADIVQAAETPVELGGGLRTEDDVARVLDMGVQWAIVGTSALSNRPALEQALSRFGARIVVGIDARDGKVAVEGWTETSNVTAIELAVQMQSLGVGRIIFTDIATDGMLAGPNIESTLQMAQAVTMAVTASGGVTTLDDVRRLSLLGPSGVTSCIVGRALYSGTIDLVEAVRIGLESIA